MAKKTLSRSGPVLFFRIESSVRETEPDLDELYRHGPLEIALHYSIRDQFVGYAITMLEMPKVIFAETSYVFLAYHEEVCDDLELVMGDEYIRILAQGSPGRQNYAISIRNGRVLDGTEFND